MKVLLLFLLLIISVLSGHCQLVLSGSVVDSKSKQPIPYANIGIVNTEVGTISNADGSFSIKIPAKYADDTILFSSLGYTRQSVRIPALTNYSGLFISLEEAIEQLAVVEIAVRREKLKTAELGNGRSLLLSGQLHYDTLSAGSAMALLIDKKEHENLEYLNKASLYIAKNLSPEFKVRLRFMSVDSATGKPGRDLVKEQYIKVSAIKRGWLDFNINKTHKIKKEAFFLVFEWILDSADRAYVAKKYEEYMQLYPDRVSYDTVVINNEKISTPKVGTVVAGTIFGVTLSKKDRERFTCYSRANSFGEWKRSSGILSAKVTLSNYPTTSQASAVEVPCKAQDDACTINLWAHRIKEKYGIQGLQVSIGKNGTTLFSGGYGYADVEQQKKVTRQTQFRIASLSKTMTSAALMQLYDRGQLHPDTTIQTYVPAFPEKPYPVTVNQLAGHLGGIRDYYGKTWEELFIQDHYSTLSAALTLFKDDSLAAQPGTQFLYSSYGYMLLGAAIEHVSGQSYLDYMQQHVWEPLHMTATYGEVADSLMAHKSKFYFVSGEEATPYDLSYSYPTGGLLSTTDDLVKFGSALVYDTLLDKRVKKKLFETQYTASGQATGYGLGWYLGEDSNKHKIWYHTGELPSSGSILLLHPAKKLVIALLSNSPIISETENGFLREVQQLAEMIQLD